MFRRPVVTSALAFAVCIGVVLPAAAQFGRGGDQYTPEPGARDLKATLFNWAWHTGMLRGEGEFDGSRIADGRAPCRCATPCIIVETAFDLDVIATLLRSNRLRFLGFAELSRSTLSDFRARFPQPEAETDLAAWGAFEAERPETFLGMYRFWCRTPG